MIYRFEHFEVDDTEFRLSEDGKTLQVEPKALRVLLCLLENRNKLVHKQELLDKVWKDAFVTESTLTRTISLLRKVLADDTHEQRLIETVPTLGYRFKGAVEIGSLPLARERTIGFPCGCSKTEGSLDDEAPGSTRAMPERGHLSVAPAMRLVQDTLQPEEAYADPGSAEAAAPASAVAGSHKWLILAFPLLLVVGALLAILLFRHHPKALTEKDTVVLADFANSTGDSVFDDTLRQGMIVQLEESPFLTLVSEDRVQHTLGLMGQPAAQMTPQLAREVCERTDAAAVLDGSIARLGGQYVIGLRAASCHNGALLDQEQVQAARKEDVLNALTQIASRFRTRVGESLATVKQHDTPLAEATTPSLEALKAYSEAWRVAYTAGSASAVPFVKRSIEIDPKFAMAYAYLGRLYGDMGESGLARESVSEAYQLRERASDRERLFIAASFDRVVTGNLEKARETCELWAQTYPRDVVPRSLLSGGISVEVGLYEKGAEDGQKAVELDPDSPWGYVNLAFDDISLGRLEQAKNALHQASERNLEIPDVLAAQYDIAFLEGDRMGMERPASLSMGKAGAEDWIADKEAFVLAYSGHLQKARSMSQRAVDLAKQAENQERSAQYETAEAVREALFGNEQNARRTALAARTLSKGRDVEYGTATALARSGDSSLSQGIANALEKRFPEDTLVRFNYLPTLRALLALNNRNPSKAIELLQTASPYELGSSVDSAGFLGALYPAYVRGEAYLMEQRGTEAAAEFQKILDHRGIVVSDPIGALARLQLARAYELAGDKTKARTFYRDFLLLWRNADPEIPILKQAEAEYTKLK